MAAQAIKNALPSHLLPSAAEGNGPKKHHGKTQSHMVCFSFFFARSEAEEADARTQKKTSIKPGFTLQWETTSFCWIHYENWIVLELPRHKHSPTSATTGFELQRS